MTKRARIVLGVLILAFAIVGAIIDRTELSESYRPAPAGPVQSADDYDKYHERIFTVVNIVDGDTVDIDVPDGQYQRTRIRLLGIDTPEVYPEHEYFGPEASDYAGEKLLGQAVKVILDQARTRCFYGRLLAYLELEDGTIFNEQIIIDGYAYADSRFEHPHYDDYLQLQEEAIGRGVGIWQDVQRHQLPGWLRRENPDLLLDN